MAVDLEDKERTGDSGVYDSEPTAGQLEAKNDADTKARAGEDTDHSSGLGSDDLKDKESGSPSDDNPYGYHEEGKGENAGRKPRSRKLLVAGGAGGGGLLIALVLLMILLGSLKGVHFATVMRVGGFATTQSLMRNQFSQVGYENAVLTEDSARGLSTSQRSMFDRIRGINANKTLEMLGEEKNFKIYQTGDGVQGFEIKGTRYNLDDFASKFQDGNGVAKKYNDLSLRERLTVKNDILSTVGDDMSDILKAENRSFRNSFFKGFRDHFDIRTSKWAVKAREMFGKTPTEAETQLRTETVEEVTAGDKAPGSAISQVDEAGQGVDDAIENDVKNNLRQRSQQWIDEGLKKAGVSDGITGFEDTLGKVSTGVLIATAYCMIHDANTSLQNINPQLEARAQRNAHDIQTTSEQIQSHDVNAEAVGAAAAVWDGSDNVPPANSAALYLRDTYKSTDSFDDETAKNLPQGKVDLGTAAQAINYIDTAVKVALGPATLIPGGSDALLDSACSALMNPAGMAAVFGIELFGSVITAGGEEGFLQATKTTLQQLLTREALVKGLTIGTFFAGMQAGLEALVSYHSSAAFSGAETGADKYNTGAISTNYQNAAVGRGVAYGRPLSKDEARSTANLAMTETKSMYDKKPLSERYFAIDNPYSLTGNLAAIMPSSFTSFSTLARTNLSHLGSTLSNLFGGGGVMKLGLSSLGFAKKAHAATSSDLLYDNNYFGIQQWGWSTEEQNIIQNDPDYDIVQNAGWVKDHGEAALDQKYSPCYTPAAQTDVPNSDDCSQASLSSVPALHWRLYKLHSSIIDQLNDNEVTEDSGTASPAPTTEGTPVGNLTESSLSVPCAAGTTDLTTGANSGGFDGYTQGNLVKIRLCALPNLPSTGEESSPGSSYYVQGSNGMGIVNSRVSGAVFAMVNAAKAANIPMKAGSTFRTMAHQIELCGGTCDGSLVARPGNSNHQMGLAIDFEGTHLKGSSSTSCSGRARDPGSPVWVWLKANALNYGYRQYTNESWHWDPVDTPSRCGPDQ